MVERVKTSHAIRRYVKANNKHIKFYDKNEESSYLNYWDVINCMDGQYHKSFLPEILFGLKIDLNFMKFSKKQLQ